MEQFTFDQWNWSNEVTDLLKSIQKIMQGITWGSPEKERFTEEVKRIRESVGRMEALLQNLTNRGTPEGYGDKWTQRKPGDQC